MKNKMKETDIKTDIWEKIRKRAKEIQKRSELLGKITEGEKEKIFRERADKLSLTEKKSDDGKDLIKIISFNIGNELYGIDIKYLNEVYEASKITHIPCTPQTVSGLISLRGSILTVLNLSSLLNPSAEKLPPLQNAGTGVGHKILILGAGGIKAGISVDKFGTLYELSKDNIQPVSSLFLERNKIIKHEFPVNNASLWIIDVEELLSDDRLIVNEDV
jgi:purine-binding chemotaxis protein CheW